MSSHQRSRRWVFTLNNPSDERVDDPQWWPSYRWVFWQKELSSTGTEHLQGLVVWNNSKNLNSCKRANPRAHWEVMRGTLKQAKDYCSKDETRVSGPWERGHQPQQGARNELYEVQKELDKGKSMKHISERHFAVFVKFHRGFEKYRLLTTPPRNKRPSIFIFWGASGVGKTKLVRDIFPNAFFKPKNKWWDSYNQEEVVIFDEFYSWIAFDNLLRILDWYPLILETKGGSCQYTTAVHCFTSNTDPRTWYHSQPNSRRKALFRRFLEFGNCLTWNGDENKFVPDDLTVYVSTL